LVYVRNIHGYGTRQKRNFHCIWHTDCIKSIFQLSNEKITSSGQDGKIIIWSIDNGECLKTIVAHSETISNEKIISCLDDKTIKVWDIETGVCLKNMEGHIANVYDLDLSN
jgi:WD40 repeat protein